MVAMGPGSHSDKACIGLDRETQDFEPGEDPNTFSIGFCPQTLNSGKQRIYDIAISYTLAINFHADVRLWQKAGD